MPPLDLLLIAASALYLAFALTKTKGPFHLFETIREKAPLGGLTQCMVCAMPWMAGLSYLLLISPFTVLVYVFAAAGLATFAAYYGGLAQQ